MTVHLVGSGVEGDPYRAPLPTYTLIAVDHLTGIAVVDIPDDDAPPNDVHRSVVTAHSFERAAVPPDARKAAIDAWHAHLDERYEQHAGRFRPIPI